MYLKFINPTNTATTMSNVAFPSAELNVSSIAFSSSEQSPIPVNTELESDDVKTKDNMIQEVEFLSDDLKVDNFFLKVLRFITSRKNRSSALAVST